jgi:hypothetical protein
MDQVRKKLFFSSSTKQLILTRRSTVLNLPVQEEFPGKTDIWQYGSTKGLFGQYMDKL